MADGSFQQWLTALEQRHLAELTFSEVARALRALSSTYVERRERLTKKSAFDSAGKRAAYALYYNPMHYVTVHQVLNAVCEDSTRRHVLDLGCGAGAAAAAWAARASPAANVTGIDTHPWALAEAAFTYRTFDLRFETRRRDAARVQVSKEVDAVVAGWMLNELNETAREGVRQELVRAASRGTHVLIVEPIATRVSPWWPEWVKTFTDLGGRADEWQFQVRVPELLQRLARAAGLRHEVIKARSLYVATQPG